MNICVTTYVCVRQHFFHDKIVVDLAGQFPSFVVALGFLIVFNLKLCLKNIHCVIID